MDNWQGGFASAMQAGFTWRRKRKERRRREAAKGKKREREREGSTRIFRSWATVRRPSSWSGLIYEWDQASEEVVGADWSRLVPLWYHIDQSFPGLAPLSGSPSYQDTARPPPLPSPFSPFAPPFLPLPSSPSFLPPFLSFGPDVRPSLHPSLPPPLDHHRSND